MQSRELDRLLARVVSARETVDYADRRLAATVEYARPQLFGATVPARVRASLGRIVSDTASGQVAALQAERDRAAGTAVLGWHRSRRRARADLLRYLDGRLAYLREVSKDAGSLYLPHPELARQLAAAKSALRVAAGVGGEKRVDRAFR